VIAAALLAVALQADGSPSPAASTSPKPYPCAPTVAQALTAYTGKDRLEPDFAVHTYHGYALVLYGVKNFGLGLSAWFKQRGNLWCVIATGGDAISAPFEIPYRTSEHLMMDLRTAPTSPRP
jgi:hypothetical protein